MESNTEDFSHPCNSGDNSLHSVGGSCVNELERATEGRACMDGMGESIRQTRILRWCSHCKHEVPEHVMVDICDLCGGEITKIER